MGQWWRLPQEKKKLIERRVMRYWTQPLAINDTGSNAVRRQACFCAENYTCSLKNQQKTAATRAALFDSNMHKSFVGWDFASDPIGECFLSGRGQGHVSNFYIVDLENFATASRRYTGDIHNSVVGLFMTPIGQWKRLDRVMVECTCLLHIGPL